MSYSVGRSFGEHVADGVGLGDELFPNRRGRAFDRATFTVGDFGEERKAARGLFARDILRELALDGFWGGN